MNENHDVFVVEATRTPIGRFGGTLKNTPLRMLGETVVKSLFDRARIDPASVQSIAVGNVLRTEASDAYISRIIGASAGMAAESQAVTLNRLCGSGLEAVLYVANQIHLGEIGIGVAAGAESMSRATYSSAAPRFGMKMGALAFEDDMLTALTDPFGAGHMGVTAENVAKKYGVSREAQDAFALESHKRAIQAISEGRFREQITPVEVAAGKTVTLFEADEHPRADVSLEDLSSLKPAFVRDGGVVTAGNASGLNDGAGALLLASGDYVCSNNLKSIARLVAYARCGVDPSTMGEGPIPAVRLALKRANLSVEDLDVIESNEAFAAQAIAVAQMLGLPEAKTNPNGGAIALGHPIGATGAILTTKCLFELRRVGGRFGLVTLCIGGGQGIAAIFQNVTGAAA